ncbi:MAG: toxin-antitoxin system HicB family antitoxin [Blastocatellales bacterium]|nr:toxin-antitoxin system HicB family antitoxin [Blastocatellales bacterium]
MPDVGGAYRRAAIRAAGISGSHAGGSGSVQRGVEALIRSWGIHAGAARHRQPARNDAAEFVKELVSRWCKEITAVVREVLKDLAETGEDIPEPLSKRRYSGKLNLRMPEYLHRFLATEAAGQGILLNQWINLKLSIGSGAALQGTRNRKDLP